MPINTRHPEYQEQVENWQRCRDTIEGEQAVRERIETYLPPPPGMKGGINVASVQQALTSTGSSSNRYAFYASFAEFPEIVGPTINGIQGLIHAKKPEVVLPGKLDYLLETATGAGDSLWELWEEITREVMSVGRVNLLAEVSQRGDDRLYLCPYVAESLINWRVRPKIQGGQVTLCVLEECESVDDPEDAYALKEVKRWRELLLTESGYVVRLWQANGDGKPEIAPNEAGEEFTVPTLFGKAFGEIPMTPINAVDNDFRFGSIPSLPMVRRALAIFRKSADYHRSLYIKGDPQPVLFGVDPSEKPTEIGGGSIWCFQQPEGKAQFLDIDGQGIPLMRQAIQDEFERFSAETGRLMDVNDKAGAESGVALKQRHSMQLVTVKSLVINAASGLQAALRQMARLMGLSPDEIKGIEFRPNLDFAEAAMTADELLKLVMACNQGAPLSRETVHSIARRRGLTMKTYEDEQDEISQQGPALGAIGSGSVSGNGVQSQGAA